MPGMVGGFGNKQISILSLIKINDNKNSNNLSNLFSKKYSEEAIEVLPSNLKFNINFCSYLAGLIEGDGTFAIHSKESTAKKYSPKIIIVFKEADLPLVQYLKNIINCGTILKKPNRGYILWQIQDIVQVFTIVNIINGFMRTPKIEALERTINWINEYIKNNKNSKLITTKLIISKIEPIILKSLDTSSIDSNAWLSGFTDSDGNFSINIHKRTNKNSTRVQLYYRMEIRQTYHKLDSENKKVSFFPIMSKLALFLNVNLISRSRIINEKQFFSFIVIAHNKESLSIIKEYFFNFPLLSSKYLDFKDWNNIIELQKINSRTTSYLNEAIITRKNFNSTRTIYNWDHLKDCYLINFK
jgi:hypothetical protein